MRGVSEAVQPQDGPEETHVSAHGREAIHVRCLRKGIHQRGQDDQALGHTQKEAGRRRRRSTSSSNGAGANSNAHHTTETAFGRKQLNLRQRIDGLNEHNYPSIVYHIKYDSWVPL